MIVFLLLLVVLLIGLTAAAVMGKIGGFMPAPTSSQAFPGVLSLSDDPARSLSAEEIGQLRFDQALRGYRMNQVDEVLDALRARLSELETELASLPAPAPAPAPGASSPAALGDPPDTSTGSAEQ